MFIFNPNQTNVSSSIWFNPNFVRNDYKNQTNYFVLVYFLLKTKPNQPVTPIILWNKLTNKRDNQRSNYNKRYIQ